MARRTKDSVQSKAFGERLRAARQVKQLTQVAVAELVEISPVTLSKLETGAASPSHRVFLALANALSVSPNYLAGWDEPEVVGIEAETRALRRELDLLTANLSPEWLRQLISSAKLAAKQS